MPPLQTVQRVEVRNPDFDQPLTVSETKSSFQPLSYVDLLAIKIDPVRRLVGEGRRRYGCKNTR